MSINYSRLEHLPNELLIDIFQYFNVQDLFQAFYNLNFRFNILLQTLNSLLLTLPYNYSIYDNYFPYIRILIINRAIDINLNYFSQIQHLILRYPTDRLLAQLNNEMLPCLKHLRINHMHVSVLDRIPELCKKIFSNTFPNLVTCYLFEWSIIPKFQECTQLLSLRVLKIGTIDLFIYKAILSVCPNLYFFQLATVLPNHTYFDINQHRNLKRMTIRTIAFVQPWEDENINICLSYVPYLEYLCIHRADKKVTSKYDWFASVITRDLLFLRQFDFYLHVFDAEILVEPELEITLRKFQENFYRFHSNQYHSRFIIIRAQVL